MINTKYTMVTESGNEQKQSRQKLQCCFSAAGNQGKWQVQQPEPQIIVGITVVYLFNCKVCTLSECDTP